MKYIMDLKLFLLSIICNILILQEGVCQVWSYDNVRFWSRNFPACNGKRQSPININTKKVRRTTGSLLQFIDYDRPFRGPILMKNIGTTASVMLTVNDNGQRARIILGNSTYNAMEMHFHWPSEHVVNGRRFNAEIHIRHRNQKYHTREDALKNEDGFLVLTLFVTTATSQNPHRRGFDTIFNRLPQINVFNRQVTLENGLSLSRFLPSINRSRYYYYKGSLTTPPCSEVVEYYIFLDLIFISDDRIQRLYQLRDRRNRPLRFTNRPLQDRPVFCSAC